LAAKVVSGARCRVFIGDNTTPIGIFNSISYGLTYDAAPVFILGRFSAAEIDYTAQEVVGITCSGWRVLDHGPHADGAVPHLQDLLNVDYLTMHVDDRLTGKTIASFVNVRATGYTTTISARQLEEVTVNFVGILVSDEDKDGNSEAVGSTILPQT